VFLPLDLEKFVTRVPNAVISGAWEAIDGQIPFAAVSTPDPSRSLPQPVRHPGVAGLLAAMIIGVQALGCATFAVVFPLLAAEGASLSSLSHVMFSVFTFLFAIGLGCVARGLWRGASWSRTAAAVWLVLLLPVGWAMVSGGSWLGGLLIGTAVLGVVAVAAEARGIH
jgi:hypothetical protein